MLLVVIISLFDDPPIVADFSFEAKLLTRGGAAR
jgi:hypothetical protein